MAKNLVNGTNIIVEETGDNINLNLSSTYTNNLSQTISDSFKSNNIYSTTETVIGKWIDDKPIYRKVIHSSTAGVLSGVISFQLNISSFGQIVDVKYFFLNNNAWHFKIPEIKRIKASQSGVVSETVVFEMETDASFSYDERYMIVEYTKTTD